MQISALMRICKYIRMANHKWNHRWENATFREKSVRRWDIEITEHSWENATFTSRRWEIKTMEECFARVLVHLWHFHNTRLKPPSTATYWTGANCFPTFHKYFTGNCFDFFLKLSFSIEWCVLTLFRVFPIKSYFRTRPVYTTQPFQSYLREIFIIVTPADEKCPTFVRNILWCFLLLFNLRRKLPRVLLWKSSSSLDSKPITWKQSQQAISAANVEFLSWDETQCNAESW